MHILSRIIYLWVHTHTHMYTIITTDDDNNNIYASTILHCSRQPICNRLGLFPELSPPDCIIFKWFFSDEIIVNLLVHIGRQSGPLLKVRGIRFSGKGKCEKRDEYGVQSLTRVPRGITKRPFIAYTSITSNNDNEIIAFVLFSSAEPYAEPIHTVYTKLQ